MTNKPLTIDDIFDTQLEYEGWAEVHLMAGEVECVHLTDKAKQQLSQLIAEIIGEDEPYIATFNHDTPTHETAAGIAKQKLRAEQRQRALERGIDL